MVLMILYENCKLNDISIGLISQLFGSMMNRPSDVINKNKIETTKSSMCMAIYEVLFQVIN